MVSRDRVSVTGSTVTSTVARIGSVDAPHAPGPGRVDVGQLGGDGPAGAADAPGGHALRAHLRRVPGRLQVTVDDALLPLVEPGRVGGVGEHLRGRAGSISVLVMIGGMSAALLEQRGVPGQVQRPALGRRRRRR